MSNFRSSTVPSTVIGGGFDRSTATAKKRLGRCTKKKSYILLRALLETEKCEKLGVQISGFIYSGRSYRGEGEKLLPNQCWCH